MRPPSFQPTSDAGWRAARRPMAHSIGTRLATPTARPPTSAAQANAAGVDEQAAPNATAQTPAAPVTSSAAEDGRRQRDVLRERDLRAVATQVHLERVVLPPPSAAPIDAEKAQQLLGRIVRPFDARTSASAAHTAPPAPQADDAGRLSRPIASGQAERQPPHAAKGYWQQLAARVPLPPRALAALQTLVDGPQGAIAGTAAATQGGPRHGAGATFSLRGATPPSGPGPAFGPQHLPTAGRASTPPRRTPKPMHWNAFSALVSRRQLYALCDLLLLRVAQARQADDAQLSAGELERLRAQHAHDAKLLQALLGQAIGRSAIERERDSAQTSVLRNAEKSLQRANGSFVAKSGAQGAELAAKLCALVDEVAERQRAERRRAGAQVPGAGEILAHVPGQDELLQRTELTRAERAALNAEERQRYDALADQLAQEERTDVVVPYARRTQAAQALRAVARRAERAAKAQAPGAPRQALLAYAGRCRDAADEHARAAQATGYLTALFTVHRGTKGDVRDAILEQAHHCDQARRARDAAAERHAAAVARCEAAPEDAQARQRAEAARHALRRAQVQVDSYTYRLGGLGAAVRTVEAWHAPAARAGRRDGADARQASAARRLATRLRRALHSGGEPVPTDDPSLQAAKDWAEANGCDALAAQDVEAHFARHAEQAVAWAQGYRDPAMALATGLGRRVDVLRQAVLRPLEVYGQGFEGAGQEIAGGQQEARTDAFAALLQAQQATHALCQQLLALIRSR